LNYFIGIQSLSVKIAFLLWKGFSLEARSCWIIFSPFKPSQNEILCVINGYKIWQFFFHNYDKCQRLYSWLYLRKNTIAIVYVQLLSIKFFTKKKRNSEVVSKYNDRSIFHYKKDCVSLKWLQHIINNFTLTEIKLIVLK